VNAVCPGPINSELTRGFDYGVEGYPLPAHGRARGRRRPVLIDKVRLRRFLLTLRAPGRRPISTGSYSNSIAPQERVNEMIVEPRASGPP
jgi:hypothetical protein